jgi:hypothetical protein
MKYLLDVNVLVALGFLQHEFHERVASWVHTFGIQSMIRSLPENLIHFWPGRARERRVLHRLVELVRLTGRQPGPALFVLVWKSDPGYRWPHILGTRIYSRS